MSWPGTVPTASTLLPERTGGSNWRALAYHGLQGDARTHVLLDVVEELGPYGPHPLLKSLVDDVAVRVEHLVDPGHGYRSGSTCQITAFISG